MQRFSQTVSRPHRLPGPRRRNSFKYPGRDARNGARQIENKRGKWGSKGVPNCLTVPNFLIVSNCLTVSPLRTQRVVRREYGDFTANWYKVGRNPRFAEGRNDSVDKIWHIEPGRPIEPGVIYAGVSPAALFKSADGGDTWSEVESLSAHPTHDLWEPGFGGLCLHSMVLDPTNVGRMWVGISSVGVFGTQDGGKKWSTMNAGVRADFLPDPFPEFGQCPHKMLAHPSMPERLYQQNHCGFFRSDDAGRQWLDLSEGLPSRFGFVVGTHSTDPDTIFVVPEDKALHGEEGGGLRYVTDAKFRVYRSRNAGEDWEPLTNGLPQRNAYLHVMCEGMATDSMDECGVYVGTTTGQIFYSRDDGDTWELLIDYLPPINSVDCGMVV